MNLLSAKKSLIFLKEQLYESTSRKCFVPAAQRPNIAVLSESEVRAKFTRIFLRKVHLSVDGCWEMKTWLDQGLIQICGRLGFW